MANEPLRILMMDVWLLEQLRNASAPGLTLDELQTRWTADPTHKGHLGRSTMTRHRKEIEEYFGIIIDSPNKRHYRIANPELLALDSLVNDLLASVHEYIFLDQYRDLGDAIQPQQIWAGLHYLQPIGEAIRFRKKLRIRHQKFTDETPTEAIVHPYCLKASQGRWYLLAMKEGSEHPAHTYALDRTLNLKVLDEHYEVDPNVDVKNFFRDVFGIWVDTEKYPVRDLTVTVPRWVSQYWTTLPLHHSQKVVRRTGDTVTFHFHISPTPDFLGELMRWGVEIDGEK